MIPPTVLTVWLYPDTTTTTESVVTVSVSYPLPAEPKKKPITPWERHWAAYTPVCRDPGPNRAFRRVLAQQRPRDGLHAIN